MNQQAIPQEIKDFAESVLLAQKIEKIGTDLDLHIDQIGELDSLVRQALLGIIPREALLKKIAENLEVEDLAADRILKATNTEVFMKLRELIIETHQENHEAIIEETLAHIEDPRPTPPTQPQYQPQPTVPTVSKPAPTVTPIPIQTQAPIAPIVPPPTTLQTPTPHDVSIIPGEKAHDVPHVEPPASLPIEPEPVSPLQSLTTPVNNPINGEVLKPEVQPKKSAYDGVDPYREPIS